MNSHIAEETLALYAGGDLPADETAAVEEHLGGCPQCAATLAELSRVREFAGNAAQGNPPSVPEPFADDVLDAVKAASSPQQSGQWYHDITAWHKVAAAAAILVIVFWTGRLSKQPVDDMSVQVATPQIESISTPVTVDGSFLRMLPVVGPIPMDEPLPESAAGVYLVLYRPRPDEAPDRYTVEYVGERTADNGDISENLSCLLDRAGSRDNIYIVLYPMPVATPGQRAQVARALIQAYKPYCNSGV